jgi:acyl-CoA dehydrogenase
VVLTLPGRRKIFAEDHEAFRDSVARFVATEVSPHLDQWRERGEIPRTVFAAAGAAGFLGTTVPEEFGGGGADDLGFTAVLVEETASAGTVALAWAFAAQAGVAAAILTEPGCTRWLSEISAGELITAVGTGELTVADGRVSGRLPGVIGARIADLLLVDLGGADVVAVEIDQPGLRIAVTGPTLAGREAGVADVILDGAVIGAHISRAAGRELDLWFAVTAAAAARAALGLGIEYVGARRVFGRRLAEFENTRFRLAELSAATATTTAFVDSCVAAGATLPISDAAAARLVAHRLLDDVVDQCMQLHGGYGYMREYPISTAFADARFLRLAAQRFSDPRTALASGIGL